jgi:hypothetical protein
MKRFRLVLVVLVAAIVLTGCCYTCSGGYVTPSQPKCSLTVVANSPRVWGWIVIDGNSTEEYINPYQSITIYGISCSQTAVVYIVDNCGSVSHEESVYIVPGTTNYVYFNYWDDDDNDWYKDKKDGKEEQNDCHNKN